MSDLYKYAALNKLRFPSIRGALVVEQLFDMPLSSISGFDLDTVAREVNAELKACGEESFVSTTPSPRHKELEVALDVVKDVIAYRQAKIAESEARKHRAVERRRLLDALEAKKDQALSEASIDELEKQLAALDD